MINFVGRRRGRRRLHDLPNRLKQSNTNNQTTRKSCAKSQFKINTPLTPIMGNEVPNKV
jgi:hypothetical protein